MDTTCQHNAEVTRPPLERDNVFWMLGDPHSLVPTTIASERHKNVPCREQARTTAAPGVGTGPAILGGALPNFSYEAGLVVLHPSNKRTLNLVVQQLVVEELPLAGLGYDAIIGRDVLASCVLIYDGPAGSVTLAY